MSYDQGQPNNNDPYIVCYNFNGNSYDLFVSTVTGLVPAAGIKFGGDGHRSASRVGFDVGDKLLTFIRFYYLYKGNPQGETIPFLDFKDVSKWPSTC
ncbi:MAG TPA: hypothetical protein VFE98_02490 [Candidatus Bathyarchaeia archaeon]|nr:hypothetical protein [Candidatus Bathyarchaeia archaeon]